MTSTCATSEITAVKLLLDTHAFLWFITDDARLSTAGKSAIADLANDILVSPASYWEVAIKVSIGKYPALNSLRNVHHTWDRRQRFHDSTL